MTYNRVIFCNDIEGFGGSLPCFPFNHHIITRSFVVGVGLIIQSLMDNNVFEFPRNIFILLVCNVIDNVIA